MSSVLWIGDHVHPEMRIAFASVPAETRIDVRCDLLAAIQDRVLGVRRIVIARTNRTALSELDTLRQCYPISDIALIEGSLCLGGTRTDTIPPGVRVIPWHRSTFQLPQWLAPSTGSLSPRPGNGSVSDTTVGLVSSRLGITDGFAETLNREGIAVIQTRPGELARTHGLEHLFWDESVTIAEVMKFCSEQSTGDQAVHHRVETSPQIEPWHELQASGFQYLHAKPLDLDEVLDSLDSSNRVRAIA